MNEATQAQIAAAEPQESTWLGANAGSGKTRVLTNRVARLLLAGVPPQNILCLTYTKAAAGEMQNRLFKTLGRWAMKPDEELLTELGRLGEDGLDADALRRARRLFARAIETPGGLKIQTIHSFCAALLRRFPLEAGVSPQFTEIDDRSAALLIETVVDEMADGPEAALIDALALQMGGEDIVGLCREILSARASLRDLPDEIALKDALGVEPGMDEARMVDATFAPGDMARLERLLTLLSTKAGNDGKAAAQLATLAPFAPSLSLITGLEPILLFGPGASVPFGPKVGKFPTKASRAELGPDGEDALNHLMTRLADARDQRLALLAAQKTHHLHRFAAAFLPRVDAAKQMRGWLDFDDLILRTRDLLTDPAVAQWVLYKLDGGIDHILVDEAQDTSPTQWDVIRLLAQEFTAGENDRKRTIFVVGDQKQSIYSFQGADPREFDRMRGHFASGLAQIGTELHDRGLAHSFRSAPSILRAVDATFPSVSGLGTTPHHIAFKSALPGRVDLWPTLPKPSEDAQSENADGWDPVDKLEPDSPTVLLANALAMRVRDMMDRGRLPDGDGAARSIHEGDILILFRRRSGLFFETMRALKQQGLEVAGADRIRLGEELAVRDLLALLRFLALPEDDLSLAAALRSPLFEWSEDNLFRLAHPRPVGSYLWKALRTVNPDPRALEMLDDLRNQTDYLRPFDLLDRILVRHRGRANLIARLGGDCEEAIDGLLAQALDYEQAEVPSLTGFLEWMAAEDVEIKRQAEAAGSRIRLMTVHGAKGLEAPIVILPDCGPFSGANRNALLPRPGSWPAWRVASAERPGALTEAAEAAGRVEAEERDRLLYVAMTRAEQWLIVAAAGNLGKQVCWHGQVEAGLRQADARELITPVGPGLRLENGDWVGPPVRRARPSDPGPPPSNPAWLTRLVPAPSQDAPTLAPSNLGGAKALPGDGADEETALRIGRQVHLLLEELPKVPQAAWSDRATELLSWGEDAATDQEVAARLIETTDILTHPNLSHLFGPDSLPEAPLSADIPDLGRRVFGTVDRLIPAPDHVLVVDFKTNRTVPQDPEMVPEGILRQMGAYAVATAQIYPDRRIETAILWTRTATLMTLPRNLVMAALCRATPTS